MTVWMVWSSESFTQDWRTQKSQKNQQHLKTKITKSQNNQHCYHYKHNFLFYYGYYLIEIIVFVKCESVMDLIVKNHGFPVATSSIVNRAHGRMKLEKRIQCSAPLAFLVCPNVIVHNYNGTCCDVFDGQIDTVVLQSRRGPRYSRSSDRWTVGGVLMVIIMRLPTSPLI